MVDQERSRRGLDRAAGRLGTVEIFGPSVEPDWWASGVWGLRSLISGLSRQVLTVAPRLFMLCDNRPGVGRDGAGSLHRERLQPTGRLFKRAARRGRGEYIRGVVSQGWPRRRLPCTASSREQPCRMPPQTLMSNQRVGWWPRSCRAGRRCRFRRRHQRASRAARCRSRRMPSVSLRLGCMGIRRIS